MVCVYRLLAALLFTLFPMTVYAINTIEYETEYMEPIEESDYIVNQNSRNIFTKIAKKAINNKARLVDFAGRTPIFWSSASGKQNHTADAVV